MVIFGKQRLPPFDRTEGNPHVRPGLELLDAQNWGALADLYRPLAPSDRYHFVQGLGRLSRVDRELPAEASDAAMAAILGGVQVEWAWRHRGGGRGNEVTEDGATNMRRCLLAADRILEAGGEVDAHDSTIAAWHIRCEMGLGGDYATLTQLTNRLAKTPEANIFAAQNHLIFVAPKWHGSIEQMWSTANAYASKPHNAAWVSIAARAHVEEWLYSFSFGDDRELQVAYSNKLHDRAFREFAGTIDTLFWETLQNAPLTGSETVMAHNNMAAFLLMVNAIDLSRSHFERMGPYMTEAPLGYFGWAENPLEALNAWRRRANLPLLKA